MFCDVQNTVIEDFMQFNITVFCMRVEIVMVLDVMILVMGDVIVCSLVEKFHSF